MSPPSPTSNTPALDRVAYEQRAEVRRRQLERDTERTLFNERRWSWRRTLLHPNQPPTVPPKWFTSRCWRMAEVVQFLVIIQILLATMARTWTTTTAMWCHRLLVAHTGGSQGVSPTSVVSKRRMVIQRMLSRPGVVRACWFHDRRKLDVADMACEVTSSSWWSRYGVICKWLSPRNKNNHHLI